LSDSFPASYRAALGDPRLRENLLLFQRRWREYRAKGLGDIDFEAARQQLAAIKDNVIAHLPQYVGQFTEAAQATGASVYTAGTPDEASRYIIDLARDRGVSDIIKVKSMVSEEIRLNHSLEAANLRVVESDLGEWIVQLSGERPSHIIAPAIHKNRRQIAELFSRVTGRHVSRDDVTEQLGVAREALRDEFFRAGMGISGANAIVAETGTVMLVTNEGNAELTTSMPPIHVVLVGIEKLLPRLDDAMLELELLAPSATGQAATVYVSAITGPADPDQELHIVLLDNGRSAMQRSVLFDEALRCIRCGACSNICPSYGVVGGHVFGYVYSGAIGLVNTPFHHGLEHGAGPQSLCVSCNACQTVCPVDIPLPRQILDVRAWVSRVEGMPPFERFGLSVWSNRRLAQGALRATTKLLRPLRRGPFLQAPGMSRLTSWRRLPAPADRPFRDLYREDGGRRLPGELGTILDGHSVAYFVQCLTDWLYPEMGLAIVDVLRALGAKIVFPAAQHCCGLPAHDAGDREHAKQMARQTIETLEHCEARFVVSGGTSCVIAMLHEYPHLFSDQPEWQIRAERQAKRIYDFTTFLDRVARLPDGSLVTSAHDAGTYHYFCQSYNVLGFREEPRHLLADVCGLDLRPLPEADVCCGFGGSVSFTRPELCKHILARKLDNVDATGTALLVTDNPGCIMHLRGGAAASGRRLEVKHTAEVVAERVRTLWR
jgi:L-lactate dehydrogenase complex protein LldF